MAAVSIIAVLSVMAVCCVSNGVIFMGKDAEHRHQVSAMQIGFWEKLFVPGYHLELNWTERSHDFMMESGSDSLWPNEKSVVQHTLIASHPVLLSLTLDTDGLLHPQPRDSRWPGCNSSVCFHKPELPSCHLSLQTNFALCGSSHLLWSLLCWPSPHNCVFVNSLREWCFVCLGAC